MFDYGKYADMYCAENGIHVKLSFDMPAGFETANGSFDAAAATLFINEKMLREYPDYEKLFILFHELRHASQYLAPEKFPEGIIRSTPYSIMYDGTCYKLVNGDYKMCRLDGSEEYFTNLYLGQPYEADANNFAYEKTKEICGDSDGLKKLYEFWRPRRKIPDETYAGVYALIDEKIL